MIEKLKALHKNSYSPYSNFPVSAVVVMNDGKEFSGVNVEDASTRAGACAERVAIFFYIKLSSKERAPSENMNNNDGFLRSYQNFGEY